MKKYNWYLKVLLLLWGMSFSVNAEEFDIQKTEKKVFRILSKYKPKPPENKIIQGTGSGFVISKNLIATNYHVAGEESISEIYCMRLLNNTVEVYKAKVVWKSKGHDLAVLQVQGLEESPLQLYTGQNRKLQKCIALGFPGQLDKIESRKKFYRTLEENSFQNFTADKFSKDYLALSSTTGEITRLGYHLDYKPDDHEQTNTIVHSAQITGGNSGGPLLDYCGRVVGINTAGQSEDAKRVLTTDSEGKVSTTVIKTGQYILLASEIKHLTEGIQKSNLNCILDLTVAECDYTGSTNWKLYSLLSLSIVISILAFYWAIKKREVISETYTQFMARKSPLKSRGDKETDTFLWLLEGKNRETGDMFKIKLRIGTHVVGRNAEVKIENTSISKKHAKLVVTKSNVIIVDLGSVNGTYVEENELVSGEEVSVTEGASLRFGEVSLSLSRSF